LRIPTKILKVDYTFFELKGFSKKNRGEATPLGFKLSALCFKLHIASFTIRLPCLVIISA